VRLTLARSRQPKHHPTSLPGNIQPAPEVNDNPNFAAPDGRGELLGVSSQKSCAPEKQVADS